MPDLPKILAGNQKEMLKLIAVTSKKLASLQNLESVNFELENVLSANTSTPIRPKTATKKTTLINSRNKYFGTK